MDLLVQAKQGAKPPRKRPAIPARLNVATFLMDVPVFSL